MTRRNTLRCLAAWVIATLPLAAAELDGKWTGTATSPNGNETILMILKTAGSEVSGSAGPNEDRQFPIENGRLEGNKFSFQLTGPNGGVFHFELTLDGDSLKGAGTRTLNGETQDGTIDLKRTRS